MPGSGAESSVAAALLSPRMLPGNSQWLWKRGPGGGGVCVCVCLTGPWGISFSADVALAVQLQACSGWPVQPVGIGQLPLVPVKYVPFPSWGSCPLQAACKWDYLSQ